MVKAQRKQVLAVGVLCVAAVFLWLRARGGATVPTAGATVRAPRSAASTIPQIGLGRVDHPPDVPLGERNIFDFGAAPPPIVDHRAQVETPEPVDTPIPTPPPPPPPPPMPLKYIGAVSNSAGLRVAVLLLDQKEILTGKQNEVVGNRYKITNIGLESVDVQDVSSGHTQRIPLRGN